MLKVHLYTHIPKVYNDRDRWAFMVSNFQSNKQKIYIGMCPYIADAEIRAII